MARPSDAGLRDGTIRTRAPALVAIASIITVAFMGSVLVTPLYPLYQHKLGFSEITLTLIYAVYAVGNVVALLVFGQISDQIGRRRVTGGALALAVVSAVLFLFATDTVLLYLGRMLIGLAVGIAAGTGTAWLADELGPTRRTTATLAAATANLLGIALGPLLGGVLAEYAPGPLTLPFVVYIAILLVVIVAVTRVPESQHRPVARIADIRVHPRIGVPRDRLAAFTAPAVTGFVIFALGGLYFALIPGLVERDLHVTNVAVGASIVFELGVFAAAFVVLARRLRPPTAMVSGLVLLLPSVALVVTAQAVRSMPLLLVAAALTGVTMALGYRGSLQVVNEIAPDERRAEVVSSYYIACFAGNSVPVIGIGVLSTLTEPLVGNIAFACTIAALSIGALVWRGLHSAREMPVTS